MVPARWFIRRPEYIPQHAKIPYFGLAQTKKTALFRMKQGGL
nr:hypothetical protein [Pseudomonas syringae pv. actinidiae]